MSTSRDEAPSDPEAAPNGDTSSDLPTAELLKRFYPKVPVKGKLGKFETLLSNKKARKKLGFDPIDSKRFLGYCIDWQG